MYSKGIFVHYLYKRGAYLMDNKTLSEIGSRFHARRKELGLTQEQVAELADLHNVTISNIELGKREPELDTYIKLCHTLQISLDYALTGRAYSYTQYDDINRIAHKLKQYSKDQRLAFENLLDSLRQ